MVTHTKTHRNTHTRRRAPTEFMIPWHTLHWGLQRAPSFCHCSDSELLSVWMCWMCLLSYIRCQIRAKQSDVAAIPSMFHKSWSKPRWALCICCKANKGNVKDFMVHHVWHMSMFTESKCIWSQFIRHHLFSGDTCVWSDEWYKMYNKPVPGMWSVQLSRVVEVVVETSFFFSSLTRFNSLSWSVQLIINLHFLHLSPTLLVIAVLVWHNTFLNNMYVKLQYANLEGSILVAEETAAQE